MEHLQELKEWLASFDGWGLAAVDSTDAAPGSCGVFPMGQQVLYSREDVLGNAKKRLRQTYVLRKVAPRGETAAGWLMDLQAHISENAHTAPRFGDDQTIRAEKGRLEKAAQTGLGIYAVNLIVEFTKEFTYG